MKPLTDEDAMTEPVNIYQEALRMQESGEAAALCILTQALGSAPQIPGAKMIVRENGSIVGTVGGGALEFRLIELAREVIASGQPRTVRLNLARDLGMVCGGEVEVFIEPIEGRPNLYIFGGGHVAGPTAAIAKMLGFKITVIDDRAEWASRERFPSVHEVVVSDLVAYVQEKRFGAKDHLLLVTRGHVQDRKILPAICQGDFGWLGVIGSRRKARSILADLREQGVPQTVLARIESPVGYELGAVSPEEIAVSIATRLVHLRRQGLSASTEIDLICRLSANTDD